MNPNIKKWLKGLISAIVGGAMGSLATALANPERFQTFTSLKLLALPALLGAGTCTAAYLTKSPMWD